MRRWTTRVVFDALEARDGVGTLWVVASDAWRAEARRRGWRVHEEPGDDRALEPASLDAVLYRAHEPDFEGLCRDLARLYLGLRPGGALHLHVPNAGGWLGARGTRDRRYEVETLRSTLEARGYQVDFARSTGARPKPGNRGARRWIESVLDLSLSALSRLGLLHVGAHLEVLARKPVWAVPRPATVVLEPRLVEPAPRLGREVRPVVVRSGRSAP